MGIHKYNRLKAAIKRVQSGVLFDSAEREQARRFSSTARRGKSTQFKIVLAEKERTGTWLSEQMGHSNSTVFTLDDHRSALWDASKARRCSHQWNSFTRLHITLM